MFLTSRKLLLLFFCVSLIHISLYAQTKTWSRVYSINTGTLSDRNDFASSVVLANDGGYLVGSTTNSIECCSGDVWLMKLNKNGSIIWQKGFDTGKHDGISSIEKTRDGGYIVTGATFRAGFRDAWIMKLDSAGAVQWQRFIGAEGHDGFGKVKQTPDGGYVVVGSTTSTPSQDYDIWLVKLNSSGDIEWQKTYDSGTGADNTYSLGLASDGFVLAGPNFSVMKLNISGEIQWVKSYGGSKFDHASSIIQAGQGHFVVTGSTVSFGKGTRNLLVIKIDSSGSIVWQKVFGLKGAQDSHSVAKTRDNGYVIAGRTDSTGSGKFDVWILKLDQSGNVQWQRTYGRDLYDSATSIRPTADGGYVVAGATKSFDARLYDVWVLKLNQDGFLSSCSDIVQSSLIPAENSNAVATNRTRRESSNTTTILDIQFSEVIPGGKARNTCAGRE